MGIEELRRPKVLGMAVFDWVASILVAVLIGYFILHVRGIWWIVWIVFWIAFGVIVHKVLGVDTMLGYYLGMNPMPKRSVT